MKTKRIVIQVKITKECLKKRPDLRKKQNLNSVG